MGGAAGISVKMAVRYGVSRGLFSNEAGMGSTPHAHALAKVDPVSYTHLSKGVIHKNASNRKKAQLAAVMAKQNA